MMSEAEEKALQAKEKATKRQLFGYLDDIEDKISKVREIVEDMKDDG